MSSRKSFKIILSYIQSNFRLFWAREKTHSKAYDHLQRLYMHFSLIFINFLLFSSSKITILIKNVVKLVQNLYFKDTEEKESYSIYLSWYRLLNYAFNIRLYIVQTPNVWIKKYWEPNSSRDWTHIIWVILHKSSTFCSNSQSWVKVEGPRGFKWAVQSYESRRPCYETGRSKKAKSGRAKRT